MKKLKANHITKVVALLVSVSLLACWWYVGGSQANPLYMDLSTLKPAGKMAPKLYYHGFQIPFTDFAFCKRYYAISDFDEHTKTTTFVTINQLGGYNNPFEIYYEDETLAARGECMVEDFGDGKILHDILTSKDAEFFDINGKLVSKVTNGTGTAKLFFSNGQLVWEAKQINFKRVLLKHWNPDGMLTLEQKAVEADDVLQNNQ